MTEAFAQTQAHPTGEAPTVNQTSGPLTVEAGAHTEVTHAEAPFPPLNPEFFASQILWLALTFGVFYYVLSKTIVPRIAEMLENRRERIALDLEAAERMRSDADEAQAAYEQELTEARERSHKIALDARDAARADADAERKRITADLDTRLETAQARIGDIKNQALADVGTIAEDAAEAILIELTGTDVSRDDVAQAVRSVRS